MSRTRIKALWEPLEDKTRLRSPDSHGPLFVHLLGSPLAVPSSTSTLARVTRRLRKQGALLNTANSYNQLCLVASLFKMLFHIYQSTEVRDYLLHYPFFSSWWSQFKASMSVCHCRSSCKALWMLQTICKNRRRNTVSLSDAKCTTTFEVVNC